MDLFRRSNLTRTRESTYELVDQPSSVSPTRPSPATRAHANETSTSYDPHTLSDPDENDGFSGSTAYRSRNSSRWSLASLKQRASAASKPVTRSWLRTLLIQLLIGLWLAPIGILLWFNFIDKKIGSALWCPQGSCRFNPFDVDSFKAARDRDQKARNLIGVLQFVAKALEVWFVAIASGFLYTLASFLVVRQAGLPLTLFTAYVEFSDVRLLISSEFWSSLKTLPRKNGERGRRLDWVLIGFMAFVCLLCALANLMGPAVAVLLMPRLQQITASRWSEKVFVNMSSDVAPSGNTSIPFCTSTFLDKDNYNCTFTGYGPVLDAWIASGETFQRQRPYLASLWPDGMSRSSDKIGASNDLLAVSQEWAVSFSFNASTTDGTFWTPSRQVLRNISSDLETFYALTNNNQSVEQIYAPRSPKDDPTLIWRKANATAFFDPTEDPTFEDLGNSLQTTLRRRGPALGAQVNFYQYTDFNWIDLDPSKNNSEKQVFCVKGWSPAVAKNPSWDATKCHLTGLDWEGGRNLTNAFARFIRVVNDTGSVNMKFGMHHAPKAVYFNETVNQNLAKCFPFNASTIETPEMKSAECNYTNIFNNASYYPGRLGDRTDPLNNDTYSYLLSNVHTIFFNYEGRERNRSSDYFGSIAVEFDPHVALADYTLDTSPFTNTMRQIDLNHIPQNFTNTTAIQVDPSWLDVIFSSYRSSNAEMKFVAEESVATKFLLEILRLIRSNYGNLNGLYERIEEVIELDNSSALTTSRQIYLKLFYSTHLLTLHMLSMLPFRTEAYDPARKDQQHKDNLLWRDGKILIWAYGLDTRTSKMGVAVVCAGMLVTLASFLLGVWTQVRVKGPTVLLAGALVHEAGEDELEEAAGREERAGRIRYQSDFSGAGWLRFDKIV